MTPLNGLAIERVALGVIDRTLPKNAWTHAGHFAAAIWLCRHRRDLTTEGEIRAVISRYNEATNTPNTDTGGYHHTITLASMRAADDFITAYAADVPVHIVHSHLIASRYGNPDWMLVHWRRELLFSVPARRGWIEPDLVRLPF